MDMGSSLSGRRFPPGQGYEDVKERAKLEKSVHGQKWISYNFYRRGFRLRHPGGQKLGAAALESNCEVPPGIVNLLSEHDHVAVNVRMEWISYSNFVARNPCIIP
ncbi:hypothetical protein, partial [Bradyrhizobium brasilense]|uniref:hypothetical protein n=1 Tax=Bradyrhizobium brasilense TaxID=1419277 RepID=UPI001E5CF3D1